jgi:hypothetical protein
MKNIVLAMAAILAVIVFAPEASALPTFSRQTGMDCAGCHFNHAPLLNAFGRTFKSSGYSMVSSQGKIESENLSIPNPLNLSVLATAGYSKTSTASTPPASAGENQGTWTLPASGGELSVFYGGRIMENTGFLSELGTGGQSAETGAAKLLWLPEVTDGNKLGLVVDTNNGQGVAHGFELLNTGAVNVHKIAVGQTHINAYSAAQWMGTNNATTGISLVGVNKVGFFNFSAYDAIQQNGSAGLTNMPLHYARLAAMFDAKGLEMAAGVQRWYGITNVIQFNTPTGNPAGEYSATVIDAQVQGVIAGMSTGIYASYGVAPVNSMFGHGLSPAAANSFSAKTLNLGVDMNVARKIYARAALRHATNGSDNLSDNAIMLGVVYEMAQNVEVHATRTNNFGDHYNLALGGLGSSIGKETTSILVEFLF